MPSSHPVTKKSKKGKLYVVKAKKLKHTKVRIPRQSAPKVKKLARSGSPSPASSDEEDKTDPLDKITLFFDLDETLINSLTLYTKYTMAYKSYSTVGPHRHFVVSYKHDSADKEDEHALIYTRPYLNSLIEFLRKNKNHFNICIWTNGYYEYAKSIVSALFGEIIKPYIFLARDDKDYPAAGYIKDRDADYYKTSYVRVIYDVLTKKKYETQHYFDGSLVKDMEFLFTHPDFKDKINRNRTILIDDLPLNIAVNDSHNVLWVNPWNRNMYCDDTLKKLVDWLDKNKTVKSFNSIKLPNYAKSAPLNKIKSFNNPIDYVTNIEKHCQAQYKKVKAPALKKRVTKPHEVKLTKIKKAIARITKTKKST